MADKSKQENIIDGKFIILEKLGEGATANVFLVHRPEKPEEKYAAKVLIKEDDHYQNEVEMLKAVSNPYITNLIDTGKGEVIRNSKPKGIRNYIVMENASKGDLFSYIYFPGKGLGEKYGKVIFSKILKGILACHKSGVCHRDLKMENILLDDKYNPKICDFGFATKIEGKDGSGFLHAPLGTLAYTCPEILKMKPYRGTQADVFSLGVVLLTLVTCKIGFNEATKRDPLYRFIMLKDYNKYFDIIKKVIPNFDSISKEFKDLFMKMISYDPKSRPTVEDILEKDEWLKDIRGLNETQMKELEEEVYKEFLEREATVIEGRKKEMEASEKQEGSDNRGAEEDIKKYFLDLKPHFAETGINMKDFIKINGDVQPCELMNRFINGILKDYKGNCEITESKNALKFIVTFENEEEKQVEKLPDDLAEKLAKLDLDDEPSSEKIPEAIKKKQQCSVQLKLYESYNEGFLIKFTKKGGDIGDYYKNFDKIKGIISQIV